MTEDAELIQGGHLELRYVTELTDRIRTRSSPNQDEVDVSDEFVSFFPDFVWAVRDVSLELKVDGNPISADEYLENCLRFIYGTGQRDKEKELNLPRLCIHKFFPKRKCFVFERPAQGKKLGQLESLQDHDMDSNFVEQVAEFCSYVFSSSKVKMLSGGIKVTGPRESLPNASAHCLGHIITRLETKLEEFFKKNTQASSDRCSALLQDIFSPLEEDLKHGIYFKAGGCLIFMRKMQELKKKYYEEPRKGIQVKKVTCVLGSRPSSQYSVTLSITAEDVLQKFLQSKEEVSDAILQTDQTLTEKENETE
ncbi:hypothetical protein U0070_010226, partial [Myodes glareolus]